LSLIQKFNYKSPEGKFINLEDWLVTLPINEQEEFRRAKERQLVRRQRAIDNGHLILDKEGYYVWIDEKTFSKKNHGTDRVWLSYHFRWLKETNQEFIQTTEETK